MHSKTVEEEPSGTAQVVATLRALAATDERDFFRGQDTMAEIFLTEDRKLILRDATSRDWVMKNAIPNGMYEYIVARTAYFDDAVANALREGIPQLVILGAGYDSRPYRFQARAGDTRIFEVDAAPTQARKRTLLAKAGIPIPANLTYVSTQFEKESLGEALMRAGYDPRLLSLFVWEGVMYYLTADAVDSTMGFFRNHSPQGSKVVFDYYTSSEHSTDSLMDQDIQRRIRSGLPSEPFRFHIERGAIEAFLSERGFRLQEHVTSQEMERRYFTRSDGACAARILKAVALATAERVAAAE